MTAPEESRFSKTEVQMIMQMMADIRAAVAGVDHKLSNMVPRPEFVQYQAAQDRRFAAIESRIEEKRGDHAALDAKIEAVEQKAADVSAKVMDAEKRVTSQMVATEKERNASYRSLNTRIWLLLAGGVVTIGVSWILTALNP